MSLFNIFKAKPKPAAASHPPWTDKQNELQAHAVKRLRERYGVTWPRDEIEFMTHARQRGRLSCCRLKDNANAEWLLFNWKGLVLFAVYDRNHECVSSFLPLSNAIRWLGLLADKNTLRAPLSETSNFETFTP